ncbi:hypothetical protein [Lysobacter changpingensis]|uniref:hypothetical protein n=1 Tax=Lysobacter changpingensis TaxID=2792784 RepID=UPI001A8D7B1A|nr:hypothetical protein [Lysobacter changpingensis]
MSRSLGSATPVPRRIASMRAVSTCEAFSTTTRSTRPRTIWNRTTPFFSIVCCGSSTRTSDSPS